MAWTKRTFNDNAGPEALDAEFFNSFQDSIISTQETVDTRTVSVESVGVTTGGSATTNTTNLLSAVGSYPNYVFRFSRGSYPLDNSGTAEGGITLSNMSGGLVFSGGSKLVFQTQNKSGIIISNGLKGLFLDGFRSEYAVTHTARDNTNHSGPLKIYSADEIKLFNTHIVGSASPGVYISNSYRPVVKNTQILDTWADGLHFTNCAHPYSENLYCNTVGDDGLAFEKISGAASTVEGGVGIGTVVINTQTSGIKVYGQSNVMVSNFFVRGTNNSGVGVEHNASFGTAPINGFVKFMNGRVENTGSYQRSGGFSYFNNGHGAYIYHLPGGSNRCDVSIENVEFVNPRENSVFGQADFGTLTLRNVRGEGGANTSLANGDFYGGGTQINYPGVVINDHDLSELPGWGLALYDCDTARIKNAHVHNVCKTATDKRGISFNAYSKPMLVQGSGFSVSDSQATPTSHNIQAGFASSFYVRGDIGEVHFRTDNALPNSPWSNTTELKANRKYVQGTQTSWQSAAPISGNWVVGDFVEHSAPGVGSPRGWICTASGAPGTWQPLGGVGQQLIVLGSDVANSANNTYADVTGLSFAVLSGVSYRFRARIIYDAAAATTGSRWAVNGPTATRLAYQVTLPAVTALPASPTITQYSTYDAGTVSTATPATTNNFVLIEGIVIPSASGTVAMRFASEITGSAITAKAGSTLEVF